MRLSLKKPTIGKGPIKMPPAALMDDLLFCALKKLPMNNKMMPSNRKNIPSSMSLGILFILIDYILMFCLKNRKIFGD